MPATSNRRIGIGFGYQPFHEYFKTTQQRAIVQQYGDWATFIDFFLHVVISLGQMSVRLSVHAPCGVHIFKTLRIRDRWTEVDESNLACVFYGSENNIYSKWNFEFRSLPSLTSEPIPSPRRG